MFSRELVSSNTVALSTRTRIGRAIAPALLLFAGAHGAAEPNPTVVRRELGCVDRRLETDKNHPLFHVKGFVEFEPVQPVRGGLFVIVEVANEGSETLELQRVTHRADVGVFSKDQVELNLPNPGRYGVDDVVRRPGAAARDPHRSPKDFGFMKPPNAWRDPKTKTIEEVKEDTVRLAPQERLQLGLLVTKVMCDPASWSEEIEKRRDPECGLPAPQPAEACAIEAGKYTIYVSITAGTPGHDIWTFHSERLEVELVEAPASNGE